MTDATRLPRALRPFSSGQYRLLVAALAASLLSAGAWLVAAVWQVVELGGSPIDLSYVAVGSSLGLVLAVLFGGVAADRIPQRRILIAVEIVRGLAFAVAAVLAATGVIEVWQIALLSFVLGRRRRLLLPGVLGVAAGHPPAGAAARGQRHRGRAAARGHAGRGSRAREPAHRRAGALARVRGRGGPPGGRRRGARRHAHDARAPRSRRGGRRIRSVSRSSTCATGSPTCCARGGCSRRSCSRSSSSSSSWVRSRCCCRSP